MINKCGNVINVFKKYFIQCKCIKYIKAWKDRKKLSLR